MLLLVGDGVMWCAAGCVQALAKTPAVAWKGMRKVRFLMMALSVSFSSPAMDLQSTS